MVVLNKIYTRTGDAGETALGTGERVPKFDLRVAAYGTVDETNATIGLALCHLAVGDGTVPAMLQRIQNDLFDLGADLCVPERPGQVKPAHAGERLAISEAQAVRLEQEIDLLNSELSPLRSFILPGGSTAAAHLHLARTICRRAERLICELAAQDGESVGAAALKYINRLSDFLFVGARYVNDKGRSDVLWVPGKNR